MQWMSFIDRIPWSLLLFLCLTLGLAPFRPPHVVEKLQMLFRNELHRPLDWFDLFLHGTPWMLVLVKGLVGLLGKQG